MIKVNETITSILFFYHIFSIIIVLYFNLPTIVEGYKNKNFDDFKDGILIAFLAFTPLSFLYLPTIIILALQEKYDEWKYRKFKR